MKRSATYGISGKEIATARKVAGLTQRTLASAASLHVNSIKRLERFASVPLSSSHAAESVKAHLATLTLPVRRYAILPKAPAGTVLTTTPSPWN